MRFSDSSIITQEIRVQPRGVDRKDQCDIAALFFDFKNSSSSPLASLKKLKLVGGCHSGNVNEVLLLKEYLVYKIYNILSVMSFQVRLLHINYKDSKGKVKPYSQYAFLIEDIKDVAKRNNCVEKKNKPFATEAANRQQITFVSVFEYMIENTDWYVGNYHNIKPIVSKNDTIGKPYAVPYDFYFSGFVNAPYAIPDEKLSITNVKERLYLGYPRTIEELKPILDIFKEKKETLLLKVNAFPLAGQNAKKEMSRFLQDFYTVIENKKNVRSTFVFITSGR